MIKGIPKMLCAGPSYLQKHLESSKDVPPGHMFNMYAPMWTSEDFTLNNDGKHEAWKQIQQIYSMPVKKLLDSVISRQATLANNNGSYIVPCNLTAPLATGLGNEHPLENGFAFLSPYGLPYLAGSSVKGSLRQAAEQMALFAEEYGIDDFCMLDVWWLFGFEGVGASYWSCSKKEKDKTIEDEHYIDAIKKQKDKVVNSQDFSFFLKQIRVNEEDGKLLVEAMINGNCKAVESITYRGAATFWDVFFNCKSMSVEIMTPHYGDYYQKGDSPHDSGQPTPISFLAVPAGSSFNLIVQGAKDRIPPNYNWQAKIKKILEFASKWQGFGAKTAIGYGDFEINQQDFEIMQKEAQKLEKEREEAEQLEAMSPEERANIETEKKVNEMIEDFSKFRASRNGFQPGRDSIELRKILDKIYDLCEEVKNRRVERLLEEIMAYTKGQKICKEIRAKRQEIFPSLQG